MEDLKQRQLQFLYDTVTHFNITNLGTGDHGCSYIEGCAIGRHLDEDLRITLDYLNDTSVSNPDVFIRLPDHLRSLTKKFLSHIQHLHDDASNWNESGLSEQGYGQVHILKQTFELLDIQ